MFKVTVTSVRPNLNTEYYPRSNIIHEMMTDLALKGKCLKETKRFLEDQRTFIYESHWDSEESYNNFFNEPYVIEYFKSRELYNQANGITLSINKETI